MFYYIVSSDIDDNRCFWNNILRCVNESVVAVVSQSCMCYLAFSGQPYRCPRNGHAGVDNSFNCDNFCFWQF